MVCQRVAEPSAMPTVLPGVSLTSWFEAWDVASRVALSGGGLVRRGERVHVFLRAGRRLGGSETEGSGEMGTHPAMLFVSRFGLFNGIPDKY